MEAFQIKKNQMAAKHFHAKAAKKAKCAKKFFVQLCASLPLWFTQFYEKPATKMLKIKLCFFASFAALREITTFKASF